MRRYALEVLLGLGESVAITATGRRPLPHEMRLHRLQSWRHDLDPLVDHSVLAAVIALVLVGLLVPVLSVWHGASGQLGPSIAVFFLAPVLLAAALGGRSAGVLVSIVSLFVWDWYFVPPFHTVTVASVRDLLTLVVFLAVALLTGQFATMARRRTREALDRARSSEALYDLSVALIARRDLTEVLPTVTERLRDIFDLEACAVLLPVNDGADWRTAAVAGSLSPDLRVEQSPDAVSLATGATTDEGVRGVQDQTNGTIVLQRVGGAGVQFLPLRVGLRSIGVLELVHKSDMTPGHDRERLLATFANGVAIALEQQRLSEEEQAAALARESDRLKSVLLSSVSHDLRTPLAGIKAAIGSLLRRDVHWNEEDRQAFLTDIDVEADRLTRLVSNLLDLSRIEAGAIKPHKEWEDAGELISRVIRRLEPRLASHQVMRDAPDALPLVRLDAVQIEQVLTNLLENAAKYSPPGTPITVSIRVTDESDGASTLRISVADLGPGIAPSEQDRIFDKFYRVTASASWVSGTGMGLAIVKGLVEAHGGRVVVDSTPDQGSTFTVVLPVEQGDTVLPMPVREGSSG